MMMQHTASVSPPTLIANDSGISNASRAATTSFSQQPHAKRQRYSSHSDSVSGSSVSTVQHVASRSSSRSGNHGYLIRSQSPSDNSLASLRQGNGSSTQSAFSHTRRKSASLDHQEHSQSTSADMFNRWSRSTDSSISSSKKHHHRASSGALLGFQSSQPLSPQRRSSNHPIEQSPGAQQYVSRSGSRQRPISPVESQRIKRPSTRENTLPNLQTKSLRIEPDHNTPSTASTGIVSASDTSARPSYPNNASPRAVVNPARPSTARTSTAPMMSLNYSRMPKAEDVKESAHFRRRSEHIGNAERETKAARSTVTTPAANYEEKKERDRPKTKDKSEREKKAMLAKALEKANTAVVLDNRQNFLGALDAYTDACMLLQQVMDRSVNPADQIKLEAIKVTYTNRIEELKLLEATHAASTDEKDLPERPRSNDSYSVAAAQDAISPMDGFLQEPSIATAREARIIDVPRLSYPQRDPDNFFTMTMADVERAGQLQQDSNVQPRVIGTSAQAKPERTHIVNQRVSKLPPPEETSYLPAPLTTRKQPSSTSSTHPDQHALEHDDAAPGETQDAPGGSSWLDTIDESSGPSSRSSSVHSKSSQSGLRRKPLRALQIQNNPDLDAAFDAAVEAAYDEGLEPDLDSSKPLSAVTTSSSQLISPSVADIKEILSPTAETFARRAPMMRTAEDDEEERILHEFTHDYGHGFNFAFGTKSALPRESDSSGYSRSTWQSSQASERATAGTSLSTVAEKETSHRNAAIKPPMPNISPVSPINVDNLPPLAPPPSTALPAPPRPEQASVRNRRFSGQNATELKIETAADSHGRKRASTIHNPRQSFLVADEYDTDTHKEVTIGAPLEPSPSDARHERILKSPPSLDLLSSTMAITPTDTIHSTDDSSMLRSRPTLIRQNKSSLSLRGDHAVLLPSPGLHELADPVPLSATSVSYRSRLDRDPSYSQRAAMQSFSSPTFTTLAGTHLFDTDLLASQSAYTPRPPSDGPVGLEPCPVSLLLRPFWLMRCLGTTITHARGGYVTTKLFIPREVWQTRGVKLRNVDDKVANCDLLTAALGQLAEVDTSDADAVMDELQRFEEVMERVQIVLSKKLGGDVGLHGVAAIFKDAPPPGTSGMSLDHDKGSDSLSNTTDKGAKSHSSKGYLSSWRKLRSKSSGAPIGHAGSMNHVSRNGNSGDKDINALASVPMTSFVPVERRGQKRDVRNLSFDGPNKEYMASLARLFQGVQVLDQIARQVEDPGLKHSSPTHVGLELSIRHAAEFFSFYICRFVLADISMLVDKFIKRGTEWVMA